MKLKKNQREVESKTEAGKTYIVTIRTDGTFHCTCPAFQWRTNECKHIKDVKEEQVFHPVISKAWKQYNADPTKGFTYSMAANAIVKFENNTSGRFVVATKPICVIKDGVIVSLNTDINLDNVDTFGGWINDKGEMEIELVVVVNTLDWASCLANYYDQKYIWDLKYECEIPAEMLNKLYTEQRKLTAKMTDLSFEYPYATDETKRKQLSDEYSKLGKDLKKGVNIPVKDEPIDALLSEREDILSNLRWMEYHYGDEADEDIPAMVRADWNSEVFELKKLNRRIKLLKHQTEVQNKSC